MSKFAWHSSPGGHLNPLHPPPTMPPGYIRYCSCESPRSIVEKNKPLRPKPTILWYLSIGVTPSNGRLQVWARGGGELPFPAPLWKCCKVFLCISSYSKILGRRIIYALLSQPVVGLWGLCRRLPLGLHLWTLRGDFRPQTPNLPTPGNNPAGARAHPYPKTGTALAGVNHVVSWLDSSK